jgi:hypothetical protein
MQIPDIVQVTKNNVPTITLDANIADMTVGGSGAPGDITVRNSSDKDIIRITPGSIVILDAAGEVMCRIAQEQQVIPQPPPEPAVTFALGYQIVLYNLSGDRRVAIRAGQADIQLGGSGAGGDVWLYTASGDNSSTNNATVHLEGANANLRMGTNGTDGDIILFPSGGDRADGNTATITLDAGSGSIRAGANGINGDVMLFPAGGDRADGNTATIILDAAGGTIRAGAKGINGDVILYPAGGDQADGNTASISLDAGNGSIRAGANGTHGDILLFPDSGNRADTNTATISLDAGGGNIRVGANGVDGDILLYPTNGDRSDDSTATIHLDGEDGDIILRNADCAEDFDIGVTGEVEPGTVMCVNEDGKLHPSSRPYDRSVAGVLSGAGDHRPAIVLDRRRQDGNRMPVAMVGKTYCRVDANFAPIRVGDLLTTSPTRGHAMKAIDPIQAFGSVIGKALGALDDGQGLVPMLVALQ